MKVEGVYLNHPGSERPLVFLALLSLDPLVQRLPATSLGQLGVPEMGVGGEGRWWKERLVQARGR